MRIGQPLKIALAVVVIAAGFATGCGSDDDEPQGSESGKSKSSAAAAKPGKPGKPKAQSARAQMVTCIEDGGFEITHGDQDAATATNYTVKGESGRRTAAVVIHSNRDDAAGAAARAGEDKGLNAVPFGRAELVLYAAADNTEAGLLANCVQKGYVK